MQKTLGIIALVAGLIIGVFAMTRHEDEKKIVDFGKLEIKADSKEPSSNTTMYYVVAALCVIGGGIALTRKS